MIILDRDVDKVTLLSSPRTDTAEALREKIEEIIDEFITVNFTLHPAAISQTANKKIRNGMSWLSVILLDLTNVPSR